MNQMLLLCAAGGFISIYTGLQPSRAGTSLNESNELLVTCAMSNPAFGYSSSGVSTADVIAPGTAVASGDPTWFRMYQADGVTPILDGSAGVGSSYDLNLTSPTIKAGTEFFITSFVVNQPIGSPFIGIAPGVASQMLNWIAYYANNGFIEVYSGTKAASANDAVPGGDVLLAKFDLGNPAVTSIIDGELVFSTIALAIGDAGGTPTWFRMYQSDGTTVLLDGSAGSGGDYDLVLAIDTISIGQKIGIGSLSLIQN